MRINLQKLMIGKRSVGLVSLGLLLILGTKYDVKAMGNSTAYEFDTATFGAGCFWCVEAMFEDIRGVELVVSGYSGGHVQNPTYEEVCNGTTGHAEAIQVTYDPELVSYGQLLEGFWAAHDPTQLNRQGSDVGTQYRSVIFFHNEEQELLAKEYKDRLNDSGTFPDPVVTEISPFREFYSAENRHQNYYKLNPNQPYCSRVIGPKLDKFREVFADKLK